MLQQDNPQINYQHEMHGTVDIVFYGLVKEKYVTTELLKYIFSAVRETNIIWLTSTGLWW